MKVTRPWLRFRRREPRRRDRGVGIFEVVVLVATLTVAASAAYFSNLRNKGQNPISGGAQDALRLSACLAELPKHKNELVEKYPPSELIPQDDDDYKAVIACKNDITRILAQSAAAAENPQWAGLLEQLKEPIENVGTCSLRITFPKSKPAGQSVPVSVGLVATIPLSGPGVVGAVQASTGETATLTRTGKLKFDGNIVLNGADKTAGTPVTLTLTPTGDVPVQCPTAVFTWTDPPSYAVTLLPPAGGTSVSTNSVTVVGRVTPAPAAGTAVTLKVNGSPRAPAATDGNGNFSAVVALEKTATLSDLTLTNPGRSLVECGPANSAIFLRNGKNPLELVNTISATVAQQGGGASTPAELTISHVVRVLNVDVTWPSGSCPGPPESLPSGQVLGGFESKNLGSVHCGIPCPASGLKCNATARVDIVTSVGATYTEAPWDVNIE